MVRFLPRICYKFFDREGNTLVLRPDFTPSVSRACATYFNPDQQVVTLSYTGNTFINNSSYQGRLKETTQMGVERIGDDSAEADAELLAMTVECLLKSGLKEFQVSVGQVDYFKSLLQDADLDTRSRRKSPFSDLPEELLWCRRSCTQPEYSEISGKSISGASASLLALAEFLTKHAA